MYNQRHEDGRKWEKNQTKPLIDTNLKMRGRLNVYEIHKRENSFTPKMSRDKGKKIISTSCLIYMVMLTLGNTIRSMSTRTYKRVEEGYPQKKGTDKKRQLYIHPSPESAKNKNSKGKLSMYHAHKSLIYIEINWERCFIK
jgi:hypothetical protein